MFQIKDNRVQNWILLGRPEETLEVNGKTQIGNSR